jgi:uncharacterized protein (AIM24 family)
MTAVSAEAPRFEEDQVMTSEPMRGTSTEVAKPALYTRERFLVESLEPEKGRDRFDIVEKRIVRIEVDGFVWIKRGSLIAYRGDLKFRRERVVQTEDVKVKSGPARSAAFREIAPISKAEGKGVIYVSDNGKHNQVVRLEGGSVYVTAENLLAFEPSLSHEVRMVGGVGILAGGVFMVKLTGSGLVAIGVKGDPLTLRVTPDNPVCTDPTSIIAWSADLWPKLKTDLEIRSLLAHGGGEPIQMLFSGEGYVVVHAKSELEARRGSLLKRLKSVIKRVF